MSLKFVTENDNVFQLLEDFVSQTPCRGAPLLDPRLPRLCSYKISLKNSLYHIISYHIISYHIISYQYDIISFAKAPLIRSTRAPQYTTSIQNVK